MSNKRASYYELDEVGKIGVTRDRSVEEMRRDAEEMSNIIQAYKIGQASVANGSNSSVKRRSQTVSKDKKYHKSSSKKRVSRSSAIAGRSL